MVKEFDYYEELCLGEVGTISLYPSLWLGRYKESEARTAEARRIINAPPALTGELAEDVEINAIRSIEPTTQVDFVELFNSGNFKVQKGTLNAGKTCDVKVNPAIDLTRTKRDIQLRKRIQWF